MDEQTGGIRDIEDALAAEPKGARDVLSIQTDSPVDGHRYHIATIVIPTRTIYLSPDVPAFLREGCRQRLIELDKARQYSMVDDYPPDELWA
jgi:hypothetical protein